jgi:CHAT domain-containing protein
LFADWLGFGQQRPLVFGNACASATGPSSNPDRPPASFASRFLELGAAAFIGTFAPISKSMAVDVAREFYTRLLVNGLPLGEALWETKQHYRKLAGADPSWLFYCLYGPPELQFSLAP